MRGGKCFKFLFTQADLHKIVIETNWIKNLLDRIKQSWSVGLVICALMKLLTLHYWWQGRERQASIINGTFNLAQIETGHKWKHRNVAWPHWYYCGSVYRSQLTPMLEGRQKVAWRAYSGGWNSRHEHSSFPILNKFYIISPWRDPTGNFFRFLATPQAGEAAAAVESFKVSIVMLLTEYNVLFYFKF